MSNVWICMVRRKLCALSGNAASLLIWNVYQFTIKTSIQAILFISLLEPYFSLSQVWIIWIGLFFQTLKPDVCVPKLKDEPGNSSIQHMLHIWTHWLNTSPPPFPCVQNRLNFSEKNWRTMFSLDQIKKNIHEMFLSEFFEYYNLKLVINSITK